MSMCLLGGGVGGVGGKWVTGLGLEFTHSGGTWGKWDIYIIYILYIYIYIIGL